MTTYDAAVTAAGRALAAARARRDSLEPLEAAREAATRGDDVQALARAIGAQRVDTRAA